MIAVVIVVNGESTITDYTDVGSLAGQVPPLVIRFKVSVERSRWWHLAYVYHYFAGSTVCRDAVEQRIRSTFAVNVDGTAMDNAAFIEQARKVYYYSHYGEKMTVRGLLESVVGARLYDDQGEEGRLMWLAQRPNRDQPVYQVIAEPNYPILDGDSLILDLFKGIERCVPFGYTIKKHRLHIYNVQHSFAVKQSSVGFSWPELVVALITGGAFYWMTHYKNLTADSTLTIVQTFALGMFVNAFYALVAILVSYFWRSKRAKRRVVYLNAAQDDR